MNSFLMIRILSWLNSLLNTHFYFLLFPIISNNKVQRSNDKIQNVILNIAKKGVPEHYHYHYHSKEHYIIGIVYIVSFNE